MGGPAAGRGGAVMGAQRHFLELSAMLPTGPRTFRVQRATPCVIGNGPFLGDDDICIQHGSVDAQHAYVLRQGDDYYVRDLESGRGTRLGGLSLAPGEERPLLPECVIHIGDVQIVARQRGRSALQHQLARGEYEWAAAALERERRERERLPFSLFVIDAPAVLNEGNRGLHAQIELRPLQPRKPYRIGSNRICRIHLPCDGVADEHVAVDIENDSVWVTQLSSQTSQLGPRELHPGDRVRWEWMDMLQVGPVVLGLYDPVAFGFSELERYKSAAERTLRPNRRSRPPEDSLADMVRDVMATTSLPGRVVLDLSQSEALVLLDSLRNYRDVDGDQDAETRLLHSLRGVLANTVLPPARRAEYQDLLAIAHARVGNAGRPLMLQARLEEDGTPLAVP
ncbi:FHA domain-containing protein [Pendulispora brunnea]|uniref:FHA domain-containing protein n=1 Tax=Pendulispora brunnea TaxID=2905690 RepID=A0ABZ2KKA1_9BACT